MIVPANSQGNWLVRDSAEWAHRVLALEDLPSTCADNSPGEDFSESLSMYSLSKGTRWEATAKARYPARHAALDKMFEK